MDYILGMILGIILTGITLTANAQGLEGDRIRCPTEGKIIKLPVDTNGCFKCTCKNGYVDCGRCPRIDDCHLIVKDHCCQRCKGCLYKGSKHLSHTEWTDPERPCLTLRCEAGVVTESEMICHTPCANPEPPRPGKCCPTCPDCTINGQRASDDRDVISDDPCLKCGCFNGTMVCAKKACPVLQCHPNEQEHRKSECCPKCTGTRYRLVPSHSCPLQTSKALNIMREGDHLQFDNCTNCTCTSETAICSRRVCPILDCSPDMQEPVAGSCCKKCKPPEESRTMCMAGGEAYEEGASWRLDECSSCKCHQGKPSCAKTKCLNQCPAGSTPKKIAGECCPKCQEADGVCMAFGDPHYKTFDGKMYSFKGHGKYQLVSDCKNKTFYIKVANQMNKQLASPTTKRVAVRFGDVRLNLQHKSRVKVNGNLLTKKTYEEPGKIVLTKMDSLVKVTLGNGVTLVWNGKSYLKVTVPAEYKSQVCGLCGDFNGDAQDDLRARNGRLLPDNETTAFGASWCVGSKADCDKKVRARKTCEKGHRVKSSCNLLRRSEHFENCRAKLSYSNYYKFCLADNCNCQDDKCHCESLMAYATECQRIGAEISGKWKHEAKCDAVSAAAARKRKLLSGWNRLPVAGNASDYKINRSRQSLPIN